MASRGFLAVTMVADGSGCRFALRGRRMPPERARFRTVDTPRHVLQNWQQNGQTQQAS